ncbi:cytochrome P450 [Colletotrichum karsti]|uniref:Cytochrome P450 monooxygenase ABA1 n=1 Tax=Colletotrichum karsti TaxID=1095194 RepID=A0A9P6LJ17_9PEZI|nr:cytochrome P450 [Colletotrichum karsti]KAF9874726.1 cytochrome P450 [Colletotrichum karsti]
MTLLAQLYGFRWVVVGVLLTVYVGKKIKTYNRLKAFRGPFSTGWFEMWHSFAILSFKSHLKYDEVCRKYGPIARVGPNDLVTSSPELLLHMSAIRSSYTKTEWFYRACRHRPDKDHVFSEMDEEKHKQLRSRMAAGYSGKENLALEASIDTHVAELLHLIRSKYLSTEASAKPMDLSQKVQFLTLDVISDVAFGAPFGDVLADADTNDVAKAAEDGLMAFTFVIAFGLYKLVQHPLVSPYLGPKETDPSGYGRMIANGRAIIKERLARNAEKQSDMIASFIKHGLTEEEMLTETTLQMIAGSDTTAASLRVVMLYLLTHPRVYAKLQAEVDAFHATEQVSTASGIISDVETRKMEYLQAVIKEGMRVHPPVTDSVPKRVPDGGDTVVIDGKAVFLPGGTNVNYAVWPLHLSKAVFGEDADEFRPERWLLETDEAKLATMNKVHELVFGYGKYQCLGRPIAMMEINKTVFELMRNFDWCLAKPDTPWKETNFAGIFAHRDMWVLASERQKNLSKV